MNSVVSHHHVDLRQLFAHPLGNVPPLKVGIFGEFCKYLGC